MFCLAAMACAALLSCEERAAPVDAGPGIALTLSALSLAGVGDVVWDIEVVAGTDTVWQQRISASAFGDGVGSAAYVGPCDADAGDNTVRVWVVGVYADDVASPGSFASGAATGVGSVVGTALPFESPTRAAPLTRVVQCLPNRDVAVRFDVTLMRPASQGFFDIAVSFEDIFCSAKLDCCDDKEHDGCDADGSDYRELLFDAADQRAPTYVLALACTAGANAAVRTDLYLDALELDCSAPNSGTSFAADLRLDPAREPAGNQCTAGDMSGCADITELNGVDADTYLFQLATYRGDEALTSGGGSAHQVFWNVALGVKPAIASCRLRARATADDAAVTDDGVDRGVIADGHVYPIIRWDADLGTCTSEPLTFGDASAPVTTTYTNSGTAFAYHYLPGTSAGSFCAAPCVNGGACVSGVCDCDGTGFAGATCASPICEQPCTNGGTCSAPDTCSCTSDWVGPTCATPADVVATGGAMTTIDVSGQLYRVHTFTGTSDLVVTRGGDVEYLIIGGGGAGGGGYNHGGGGGAGGVLQGTVALGVTSYTATIGAGGTATPSGQGHDGNPSAFAGFTAAGGGGGCAGSYQTGRAGGSGGGGCALNGQGGAGSQGNQGGTGSSANVDGQDSAAGGGGGAGAHGGPFGATGPFSNSPGIGGIGTQSSINGTPSWYAAGGNGAGYYSSLPVLGIGGASPGRGLGDSPDRVAATAGAPNTGSGGGGGRAQQSVVATSATGGAGGSGIIIVRYPIHP